MEVNIAIMNNFQSSFSFLFLDAKNRSKEIDFLAFYCSPPFYFLPFQASPILAKLQWQNYTVAFFFSVSLWKFYTEWVSLVLGFFSPEWGKENSKENMPKMTLSFIHAIVLGVQKCCGWWKGAFKKAQSKEKKKSQAQKKCFLSKQN